MFDSLISHLFSITITSINFTFSYHYDLAFKIPKLFPVRQISKIVFRSYECL